MQKQQLLYKGKAKSVYETEDNDLLILHFVMTPQRLMVSVSNN